MHQIVTTHKNTDFDAMASTIAATLIYPGSLPLIPRNVNPNVRAFWSIHKDVFELFGIEEIDPQKVDRLIVVDANSWSRLDRSEEFQDRRDLDIILWDHHPPTDDFAASWICQEQVGATITLLIRRLKQERKLLTPIQATLFLAGLYEDTGNLSFPSTTSGRRREW